MSSVQPPAPGPQPPAAPPVGQPPTKRGMSTGKILLIVGACVVGFFLIVGVACTALVAGSIGDVTAEPSARQTTEAPTTAPTTAPPSSTFPKRSAPAPKPAPATTKPPQPAPEPEPTEPALTTSQENAVGAAQNYLEYTAFSKKGLIKQLKFEKYATEDAEFAVEHLEKNRKVNWNEQAARAAKAYLEYSNFSYDGLVKQLEFEGYTSKQAEYGAKATGLKG